MMNPVKHVTRRTVIASAAFVPLSALTASAQQASVLSAAEPKILEAFIQPPRSRSSN
jgi:hypothetical protein